MATFNLVDGFGDREAKGEIDLSSDTFKYFLTLTAPNKATDELVTAYTEITAGNGYTAGGNTFTGTWAETTPGSGVFRFSCGADLTMTATGGDIGPYRYFIFLDTTPATDVVIGYVDHGSNVTLTDGNTHTLDVDANFTLFTKTIPAAV